MLTVLKIQVEDRDGIRLVHLTGPLDSTTHEEFKALMDPLVNQSRVRIVLDCENLTHLSSKELLLLGQYHHLTSHNQSFLGIAALNKRITLTMEQIGLNKLLHLYPSVASAIQAASMQ